MTTLNASPLLRRALLADGLMGIASGSLLILLNSWYANLLALPGDLLLAAGLTLLPLGLFLMWMGSQETVSRRLVWVVLAINAMWAIDSLVLLFSGWISPNLLGQIFVIGQAALVLLFLELELIGLKRSEPVLA
ncbi:MULTISPECIES: hypothetical protein [unclassified Pseudomonas]|uniref:hypothetical protein n=1 Tax=unclassified Pseudomonas TaxID=196821 RepID=UPI00244AF1DA|nr:MULTISPECIES: hypothetical protein [unclassified Pseudomonas]MDG9923305.1 hypothetical protein [Pseudomonas sp. GD04045]MDH0034618.1 hypothetical protein [Pseudomonas sp. GD04019]